MPFILKSPPPCDGCGIRYAKLFDAFMNGRGFVQLCGGCVTPAHGPTRAYLGPYPIRSTRDAPVLRLVTGDAAR